MSRWLPYHVTYPMIHLMLPTPSSPHHVNRQMPAKTLPSRNLVKITAQIRPIDLMQLIPRLHHRFSRSAIGILLHLF